MVNKEVLEIIIQARDNASSTMSKFQNLLDNIHNTVQEGLNNSFDKFSKITRKAFETAGTALSNLKNKLTQIPDATSEAMSQITNAAEKLKTHISTAVDVIKSKFKSMYEGLSTNILQKQSQAWNQLKTKASSAVDSIKNKLGTLRNIPALNTLVQKISNTFTKMGDVAQTNVNRINNYLERIGLKSSFTRVANTFSNVLERMRSTASNGVASINNVLDRIGNTTGNALSTLHTKMSSVFGSMERTTSNAVSSINSKLGTIGNNSSITKFQSRISAAFTKVASVAGSTCTSISNKVGNLMSSITSRVGSGLSSITSRISSASSRIGASIDKIFIKMKQKSDAAKGSASGLADAFNSVGAQIASGIGITGVASLSELTIGLSLSRQKMSTLNASIMQSKEASQQLLNTIDNMTNTSVVSMDQMVNAMNKIKLSTNMTNEQLAGTTNAVMKLGEASILMGNDAETAGYQMGEAFSGLNGDFQILKENFGITKEKMQSMGWSGQADDVEGYTQALEKCLSGLGDLSAVMDTDAGAIEVLKKSFRTAGRHLGDVFTPILGDVARGLVSIDRVCPGTFQGILSIAAGVSVLASVAPQIVPVISLFGSMKNAVFTLGGALSTSSRMMRTWSITGKLLRVSMALNRDATIAMIGTNAALNASGTGVVASLRRVAAAFRITALSALTNPYVLLAIAIVALVAILVYLYKTNTQVRNAFNQLGAAISGIVSGAFNALKIAVQAIWNGLVYLGQTLWTALIPAWNQLKSILAPLVPTFQHLWSVLQRLWAVLTGTTQGASDASGGMNWLAAAGKLLAEVIVYLVTYLVSCAEVILAVLVPAISFCVDIISALINFVVSLAEAFSLLAQGDVSGFFNTLGQACLTLLGSIGQAIVTFFTNVLGNLDSLLGGALTGVWNWFTQLGQSAITGIATFVGNIVNGLLGLPGYMWDCLVQVSTSIGEWFTSLIECLANWGLMILEQISVWLQMLPITLLMYLDMLLMQIGTWILGLITNLAVWGQTILTSIGTWFMNLIVNIGTWLLQIITNVWNFAVQLANAGITAGANFVRGVINWIQTLPGRVWTWLLNTINRVIQWASRMWSYAKQTASNFVRAFIAIIQSLPGRFWSWLMNTLNRINPFSEQGRQNMGTAGRKMVQAFREIIRKLPDIMKQELLNIGHKILDSASDLGKKMWDLGKNLLHNFKSALGIGSPGDMYRMVVGEMGYITKQLEYSKLRLGESTNDLGTNMVDQFKKADLSQMTESIPTKDIQNTLLELSKEAENTSLDVPTPTTPTTSTVPTPTLPTTGEDATTTMSLPSEQMTAQATQITTAVQTMTGTINPQLIAMQGHINKTALTTTTGTNTALQNNTKAIQSYNQMQQRITTSLNNIQTKNTQSWTHIKTTTQTQLNNMLHSTKNVTTQMISAWNTMKNSIINAAEQIKSQSTTRFNNLWSTISRFYSRIRNPGGAGGPSGAGSHTVRSHSAGRRIRSSVSTGLSSIMKPRQKTVSTVDLGKIMTPQEVQYVTPTTGTKRVPTIDILKYFDQLNKGAGGWESVVSPNFQYIRRESNKWKANGPKVFGKYPTGNDLFKVSEFESGTPKVSYGTFKKMAESVFNNCHYLFYWDSEKYGSWQAAAHAGYMNCSDSTDFLIALAHACGLPATKVHGHWNQFGHFWANVAGHKMDTTGWMQHRTWTPSQSHAGPAPKLDFGQNTSTPSTVDHTGTINIEMNLHVEGADNVDENTLTEALRDAITQPEILKRIATNSDFQEYDNRTKIRLNSKIARNG